MMPTLGPNSPLRDRPREKRRRHAHVEAPIQRAVLTLYESCGFSVYQNSVFGVKPIGVTPGIADLRVKQPDWRLDFDHEVKAPNGRQSKEQYGYLLECQAMGSLYVLGGTEYAIAFLAFLGLGTPVGDIIGFRPRASWPLIIDALTYQHGWHYVAERWYATDAFAASLEKHGWKAPTGRKRLPRPSVR